MLLNPLNLRLSEEKMNCSNLLGGGSIEQFIFMLRTDHEKSEDSVSHRYRDMKYLVL